MQWGWGTRETSLARNSASVTRVGRSGFLLSRGINQARETRRGEVGWKSEGWKGRHEPFYPEPLLFSGGATCRFRLRGPGAQAPGGRKEA